MGDNVNGAGMTRIECQRAPRDFFGAAVLSVFFQGKSVHRQDARISRHLSRPVRQHHRDPIAHHAPSAKVEVERVRDRKRQNVMGPVGEDGAIKCGCTRRIAVKPSARGQCMTTRGMAGVRTRCLDRRNAGAKRRPRGGAFGAHDECCAQTMTEHAGRVVRKQPLDLRGSAAALRHQHVERAFAAALRDRFKGGDREHCCVRLRVLRRSHRHERGHFSVSRGLRPGTDRAPASSACMSVHIVGCHRLPMTEAPNFMLKIPKHPSGSAYSQARRGHRAGGPEADCAGRHEVGP